MQKAPSTQSKVAAQEVPEADDDVADDWDKADLDEMAEKIAAKQITSSTGGKVIRGAEEEDEDDSETQKKLAKKGKDQQKIKNALKASKEEEKFAGGDVFGQAAES